MSLGTPENSAIQKLFIIIIIYHYHCHHCYCYDYWYRPFRHPARQAILVSWFRSLLCWCAVCASSRTPTDVFRSCSVTSGSTQLSWVSPTKTQVICRWLFCRSNCWLVSWFVQGLCVCGHALVCIWVCICVYAGVCVFVVVPRCACVYSRGGGGGGVRVSVCVCFWNVDIYVFQL